jgi:hypothetical protein
MNSFTVTTFINRSPQAVFDFMTEPANGPKWQNGTVSGEWSSKGPAGVGSTFHTVGHLLGREVSMEAEITQWNPPSLWGLKINNGQMKVDGSNKFEAKDGGTLLVQTFQGEVGGFFKIAEGLAVKQLEKQIESDGLRLKKVLEAV